MLAGQVAASRSHCVSMAKLFAFPSMPFSFLSVRASSATAARFLSPPLPRDKMCFPLMAVEPEQPQKPGVLLYWGYFLLVLSTLFQKMLRFGSCSKDADI